WFFFQLPQLPERALRADGFAFVDWLWDYWTAPGFTDEEHLAAVKRMLAVPGAGGDTGLLPGHVRPGQGGPGPGGGAAGGGPADRGADPGPVRRRGHAGRGDARPGPALRRPVPVRARARQQPLPAARAAAGGHRACPRLVRPALAGTVTPN